MSISMGKNPRKCHKRHCFRRFAFVGLSNILYSERFKESSKFFFRGEPGKGAHR